MKKLNDDLQLALRGRECWRELKESYCVDDECYLIILPEEDCQLNESAMQNLVEFLKRKYIHRAVVLSKNYNMDEMFGYNVRFVSISPKDMEGILKYYRMTQFAKNIVVVSMEEPFGCGNIVGKVGITLDDYVRDAIYV